MNELSKNVHNQFTATQHAQVCLFSMKLTEVILDVCMG